MENSQEFYVYNPVKQNKGIGRRTGKPVYKKRNIDDGADNFDDYLTDSDDDASINVTKHLQLSAAERTDSSQTQNGVLSSGKTGARKLWERSFREDAAAKSIQQLPPERFGNMIIVNPLILGSRFGRRTGKDVLAGKALTDGLEDFSAFLSDNSDSMSIQATPSPSAAENLPPSTSFQKRISSSKKSRNRTQVFFHNSFHGTHLEKTAIHSVSSEQHCRQEVDEPSFGEQGISHPHVPECIIPAVEVEREDLAHEVTSSNNTRSKSVGKGSTAQNSFQRSAENPSSRANLNTSKVKDVDHDNEKACMNESMSKATQARQEKKNLNTSTVKNVSDDIENTDMSDSMSKATQARAQKENLKASKVKSNHNEDEKTQLDLSKAMKTQPEKENLTTSKVKNVCHDNEKASIGNSMSKTTQARLEKENLNTSKVKNRRSGDQQAQLNLSKATQAEADKNNFSTSKVQNIHNEDEQTRLGLSITKTTQAVPEKTNVSLRLYQQVSRLEKIEKIQTTCGDSENNNQGRKDKTEGFLHSSTEESTKSMSDGQRVVPVQSTCGDSEDSNLGRRDETEVFQHSSSEESTNSVLGRQRVVPVQISQTSAVKQVQHIDHRKGNKTKSGQRLLAQSSDAQAQERNDISEKPESVVASQATSCGQKSSIAITSVHIPSISSIDKQQQSENSLQTTDLTGQQGASKYMISSSSNLNFGGDITGSVSRSEQANGGQFFGIKKRLSFSHALLEVNQASGKYKQKAETSKLTKVVPRETKSIGSFLGQQDPDNRELQKKVSETKTFVTLAASRISQLTCEAELLKALNTSTDSQDDFCIVEEDNIVFDSSEVANKYHSKADEKQLKGKKNRKSSSVKQATIDKKVQQTDVPTDNRREEMQGTESLQEENQVTNLLNNRKNRKSARVVLDPLDRSLEAQTFISLTSQKVTDMTTNRRKEIPGDKISKRKVKHSMKDEASPPKQIRGDEEQDSDTDIRELDINREVLNSTKVLRLKIKQNKQPKRNEQSGSVDLQVKEEKENNNVSNTNEKQSNLSHEADDKRRKKVRKMVKVQEKPDAVKNSLQIPVEENNAVADLSVEQNNQLKIGKEGRKTVPSKSDKSAKQNKEKNLPKDLKQLKERKLPNLRRAKLRNRSECSSDNSSSDLLQQESVISVNLATDKVIEDNSPLQENSQRYRIRTRQTSKLGQHPVETQSSQHFSVTQSSQKPATQSPDNSSVTQSPDNFSVTQTGQHPAVTKSEHKNPATVSQKAKVGKKAKQKLKGNRRNQTGRGRRNQISGKITKATNIRENRMVSRLATNFNVIYENITEEESCISNINFNNTAHSIVEVSKYNLSADKNEVADMSRNRKEKVKYVKNTPLDKSCTDNCIDIQTTSYSPVCHVNQVGHPSSEKNSDRSESIDVSVPVELLENNKRSLSRKSVSRKVRRAVKTPPRNKSMHNESKLENCSPPKLQLMSSLPNVTPRSGISFRRSRCLSSYLSDPGSCSPPIVPRAPTRDEECFTPRLKEQKTPTILSCLKNAESSVKPRRKGRRVRISSIIDQRMCSPFENEVSDSTSVATTSLLSANSSPVHYLETTTNNVDVQSRSTQFILPDLSYKIIRPETSQVEGLRRSARTRVMRLNSHKGEEIIYRRDSTGFGLVVDGIQPSVGEAKVKAAEERRRKRQKQRKLRAMNVPAKPAKRLSTHWKVDDVITNTNEVPVVNPDTNEPVLLELLARGDSATWYGPDLDPITGNEPVALCLHLKQQTFTTGEMNMRALAEKPSELTVHTLILYVICGKILLRINSVSTIVDTGDSFFIPRGTSYSIKNLRREIAKLYFVDLDDTVREHNFTKEYSMSGTSDLQTGNR